MDELPEGDGEELPKECCAKCRFFSSADDDRSWCRRYPKSVFIIGEEGDEDYYDPFSGQNWWWPTMYANDWCGEFEAKELEPDTPLSRLNLGTRAINGLECSGIDTVEKLCAYSARELIRDARNVGRGCVAEIREALAKIGKSLKGD